MFGVRKLRQCGYIHQAVKKLDHRFSCFARSEGRVGQTDEHAVWRIYRDLYSCVNTINVQVLYKIPWNSAHACRPIMLNLLNR